MAEKTYTGACHCRAVRFEAKLDLDKPVNRCNCTICTKTAYATMPIKPEAFTLLEGADLLVDYAGVGPHHPFCGRCGIHAFNTGDIPEIGGAFVSVNVNCLDDVDPTRLTFQYWDGLHNNWDSGPRPGPWPR